MILIALKSQMTRETAAPVFQALIVPNVDSKLGLIYFPQFFLLHTQYSNDMIIYSGRSFVRTTALSRDKRNLYFVWRRGKMGAFNFGSRWEKVVVEGKEKNMNLYHILFQCWSYIIIIKTVQKLTRYEIGTKLRINVTTESFKISRIFLNNQSFLYWFCFKEDFKIVFTFISRWSEFDVWLQKNSKTVEEVS